MLRVSRHNFYSHNNLTRKLCSVEKDLGAENGATLVEFAALFPIVIFILFGIIQIGLLINASITLNNAAEIAARISILGTTPPSQSDLQEAARSAVNHTLLDVDNVQLTTYTIGEDIGGGQTGNTIVLSYNYPLLLPSVFGDAGTIHLSAKAVMY